MLDPEIKVFIRCARSFGAAIAIVLGAGACSNMPRATTSYSEVQKASIEGAIKLVPLTTANLPAAQPLADRFPTSFTDAGAYSYDQIGAGDRLQVRVWESGTATVFTGTSGSDIGEVTVDSAGRLYLPYVGIVRAAGLTIPELRSAIIARLKTVVLRPQVDIREIEARSRLVTLQGDATKTGVFPIEQGRAHLGELLAEVAPKGDSPDVLAVTVRRGNEASTVRLNDIYQNPKLDIALRPGDSIFVNNVIENITVLGAAGVQGQVRISKRDFSLLDALGQARGLNPEAADPRAVFVMRTQPKTGTAPLVYQVDMRRPESVALASRFILRADDAVLISSAHWAQTRQIIAAFSQGLASVRSAATIPVP